MSLQFSGFSRGKIPITIRISDRLKGGKLDLLGWKAAEYTFKLLVSFAKSFVVLIIETYNKGIFLERTIKSLGFFGYH